MTAAEPGPDDTSPDTIERGRGYRSFAQVDEALIRDHRVVDRALRLWMVLDRQGGPRPVAIDSYAKLGAKLCDRNGVPASEDTIRRLLRNLEENDWLDIIRDPGRVGRYVLHREPPPPAADSANQVTPRKSAGGGNFAGGTPRKSAGTYARDSLPEREMREGEGQAPPPFEPPTAQPQPQPSLYVGRCPAHGRDPNPPACGQCADARRAHEAAAAQFTPAPARAAEGRPDVVRCRTHFTEHAPDAECRSCRADRIASPHEPSPIEIAWLSRDRSSARSAARQPWRDRLPAQPAPAENGSSGQQAPGPPAESTT